MKPLPGDTSGIGKHAGLPGPSSCTAMLTTTRRGSVLDLEKLERRYGAIAPASRSVITEDMRNSRWTDNPFQPPNASPELLEWYAKREEAIRVWRETGDDTMAVGIGLSPSREEEKELEERGL